MESFDVVTLIPHFNDLKGLKEAIQSIAFSGSMLFIIVDDGSNDKPNLEEIRTYTTFDCHIIFQTKNCGIETALNRGLEYILTSVECKYIARMDCGDLSMPHRLDRQIYFLDDNPDIKLLGSWVQFMNENMTFAYTLRFPEKHPEIIKRLPISVPFMHPAIVFRTEILHEIGTYPTQFKAAEDYAFFFKIVNRFKTANIPEVLIQVRLRKNGISIKHRRTQLLSRLRVVIYYWKFSWNYFVGITRVIGLIVLPYTFTEKIKRKFWV